MEFINNRIRQSHVSRLQTRIRTIIKCGCAFAHPSAVRLVAKRRSVAAFPQAPTYCSNTFFRSPILRCTFPPAFSAVPRSRKFGFPVALPAFSFTLPFASLNPPLILSFVLDFIRTKSRAMNAAVVNWFATEGDQHTEKQTAGVAPAL